MFKPRNEWVGVSYGGNEGYVNYEFVTGATYKPGSTPTNPPAGSWTNGFVNTASGALYLRETASDTGRELAQMPRAASLKYQSYNAAWHKVEYNGKTGFASKQYIKDGPGSSNISVSCPVCTKAMDNVVEFASSSSKIVNNHYVSGYSHQCTEKRSEYTIRYTCHENAAHFSVKDKFYYIIEAVSCPAGGGVIMINYY